MEAPQRAGQWDEEIRTCEKSVDTTVGVTARETVVVLSLVIAAAARVFGQAA